MRGAVSAARRRSACRDGGGTGRTGLGRSAVWRLTRGSDREAESVEGGVYCRLAGCCRVVQGVIGRVNGVMISKGAVCDRVAGWVCDSGP